MDNLFCIETEKIRLEWSRNQDRDTVIFADSIPHGLLVIKPIREGLTFEEGTWRSGSSGAVKDVASEVIGPRLFEQTDYNLYIKSKTDEEITLETQNPALRRDLKTLEKGRLIFGTINFGSQVGRSEFSVSSGGKPEFRFEIEVFPTKLDPGDYERILDEIQEIMTGLVLEYLKSTFGIGKDMIVPQATHLEWLVLLRKLVDDLDRALTQIAAHPKWGLIRTSQETRVERIRRSDSHIRRSIQKGSGRGKLVYLGEIAVRERLVERRIRPTLDTPEHRWLASQLIRIRRRLAWLYMEESKREPGEKRDQSLNEIRKMERRFSRLSQIEPIKEAIGAPPLGFASVQLLYAPGYREAYHACIILSLGLHIENGPFTLSLKDLGLLYEYWCFLALLRLLAEETGQPIPVREMIALEQCGLRILLQKGREQTVQFRLSDGRKLEIIYNPRFQGENFLVPQQPDIVLNLLDSKNQPIRFILDAKYRIDMSPKYLQQYGSVGPPDDALNVLYRYRGAIIDVDTETEANFSANHTVAQAIALFPYKETSSGAFRACRLWSAIERLGVGAIPILPGNTHYLAEWLHEILRPPA